MKFLLTALYALVVKMLKKLVLLFLIFNTFCASKSNASIRPEPVRYRNPLFLARVGKDRNMLKSRNSLVDAGLHISFSIVLDSHIIWTKCLTVTKTTNILVDVASVDQYSSK